VKERLLKFLFLTFVLLIGLFGCRGGEIPTLPPPPPPQPRYNIQLIPENYVGSLASGEARTSFVVAVGPDYRRPGINEIQFFTQNGEIIAIEEDPEFVNNDQYRAVIVFAKVRPGFRIKVRVGVSEKEWAFPVREIPKCRFREPGETFYYKYATPPTELFREITRWGIKFWLNLSMASNFIEGEGRPQIVFIDSGQERGHGGCRPDDVCPVFIPSEPPGPYLYFIATHEIGHVWLAHSPAEEGPKAIMSGAADGPNGCGTGRLESTWAWFVHPSRTSRF
jgi:hypothetical protein